jgi:phospholipid transport system substrate-binding protein
MILNNYLRLSFLVAHSIFFCSFSMLSQAADKADVIEDPAKSMQIVIEHVLSQLKTHQSLYNTDPQALRNLVEKSALPNLHIHRMAQLALGKHWQTASEHQRQTYVYEFQRYLIRSYTNTLYLYRNTKPEIIGNQNGTNKKTTLKVNVQNERGQNVILLLRLELDNHRWKIVDVKAEGLSLVVIARSAFDEEISRTDINAFLKNLTQQNNQAEEN